ncbi:hypothetical protein [uncultured Pontibacter sp.]|uniref:hypothetical protein n=1 Tax=uncultured Pontibacter sp. TaxID=453356 RepID=UPI00262CA170|nr:hypothetical protein [uncultured Pontibacter sp.]
MKIVFLLLALVAALGFAMKKTFDSQVLLAERLQAERTVTLNAQAATPQTVAML